MIIVIFGYPSLEQHRKRLIKREWRKRNFAIKKCSRKRRGMIKNSDRGLIQKGGEELRFVQYNFLLMNSKKPGLITVVNNVLL